MNNSFIDDTKVETFKPLVALVWTDLSRQLLGRGRGFYAFAFFDDHSIGKMSIMVTMVTTMTTLT